MFNFLTNRQTVSDSSLHLRFPPGLGRAPLCPHPHQHLLSFISLTAVVERVERHLMVVFILIFPDDTGLPPTCLWTLCMIPWENRLLKTQIFHIPPGLTTSLEGRIIHVFCLFLLFFVEEETKAKERLGCSIFICLFVIYFYLKEFVSL